MKSVSALVLIYDIRGFTAASKRLGTADLGAFATAAHREILDLFSARPPTFVKNLGDGHLLIWETGSKPDPALVKFVMEGSDRARTAFAAFAAGQEAGGAKLPRHVGIGVAVGEVSRGDDYYGVTVNLAARLQNFARPEGLAVDRTVFETAAAQDAALKDRFHRAKVKLKGLGRTVVWTDRPFSWGRLLGTVGRYAVPVLLLLAYAAAADGGLGLPGGAGIREFLDAHQASVLRPVRSAEEVRASADDARRRLAGALLAVRRHDGMVAGDFRKPDDPLDVWASSQNICALLKAPHLENSDLRSLVAGLRETFRSPQVVEGYGWTAHPGLPYTEIEPGLWTVAAIAAALDRPHGLLTGKERKDLQALLAQAQAWLAPYRPTGDGGWNIFPNQKDPQRHNPYSTTLALLALLETRADAQHWEGSMAKRDALLRSTAAWLGSRFETQGNAVGWRRTMDPSDPISEGLTLQIYAELLRAEHDAGIEIPAAILERMPTHLASLNGRSGEAKYDAGEFRLEFTSHLGAPASQAEAINFLWHPWAIDACSRWLARAERVGAPTLDVVRVRRALGHLVVDAMPAALADALSGYTFPAAETLYALSTIR